MGGTEHNSFFDLTRYRVRMWKEVFGHTMEKKAFTAFFTNIADLFSQIIIWCARIIHNNVYPVHDLFTTERAVNFLSKVAHSDFAIVIFSKYGKIGLIYETSINQSIHCIINKVNYNSIL